MSSFAPPPRSTPRGFADDVALAIDGRGTPWTCSSVASLDSEDVWLAPAANTSEIAPLRIASGDGPSFRPALCALPDGLLALALAPSGHVHGLRWREGAAPARWQLHTPGTPLHATLAIDATTGDVWLAIEGRRARARTISIGVLDPDAGTLRAIASIGDAGTHARWPALVAMRGGGIAVAWAEGARDEASRVRLARIDATSGLGAAIDADPAGGCGDAPALAVSDAGWIAVAWHVGGVAVSTGDDRDLSMQRALRVARWEPARGTSVLAPVPPAGAGGSDPRGEDQGWELPAVAIDAQGAIWLAGRSSHGHQLARLDDPATAGPTWSAAAALCGEGWGGRGRRMALARHGDEIWLARRAPEGLDVRRCPPPGAAADPSPAPRVITTPRAKARPSRARTPGVLFGDLHQHTAHSDGCGSAEDLWVAARGARGLDFAAITDHDQFCRRALGPASWRYLCELADDHDDPGVFTAFSAYEFTGPRHPGPGHKCIYFGDRVPDRVPDKNVDAVLAMCRELGAIAVPHHVGWTGGDFAHHDPALQPVWEICSVHGCYTHEDGCGAHRPRADHVIPGQFVKDALDAGLRFGFIGSTDSHGLDWHHGIARWRNPFRSGLACVVGADRTRAAILDAIRARRTYATSGAKIALRVDAAGAPMGSALPPDARGELAIEVTGTAPIARTVLVTAAGEQLLTTSSSGLHALARAPLPSPDRPGFYFYVRIEQTDEEIAWSSPIWIG